jgi:hypothetical protein
MGYGYHQPYGSSEDDDDGSCDYCGGDGCEECDDQFEEQLVQCRGITLRGTRCQITSDSMHGQRKFADAAEPLTCGSHYCTFHTDQEYERDECLECGGEGSNFFVRANLGIRQVLKKAYPCVHTL